MREPQRDKRVLSESPDEKTFDTVYGAFTLRRPSLFMQRNIHIEAARALQGLTNVDSIGELTNLAMVTIAVCARAENQRGGDPPRGWPQGFTWEKAYDLDFLTKLYNEFSEWVSSFRRPEVSVEREGTSARDSEVEGLPPATGVLVGSEKP